MSIKKTGLILLAVILVGLMAGTAFASKYDAWAEAQWYVKNQLVNPRSADFPPCPWRMEGCKMFVKNSDFTFKAYVDAKNAFGGTVRTFFWITVRDYGPGMCQTIKFKWID